MNESSKSKIIHDLKKNIRRLKLIFDELELQKHLPDDERKKMQEDFQISLTTIQEKWSEYLNAKL